MGFQPNVLRKTDFLPFPQQFEALFHSKAEKGWSRQAFVPFPPQLLFPWIRLAPTGRLSKDSYVGPWGGPCRRTCVFTSCQWPCKILCSLACPHSGFTDLLKILTPFLLAFSSICPGKPVCPSGCLSSFNSRLVVFTEVSALWWIGRKLRISRLCGIFVGAIRVRSLFFLPLSWKKCYKYFYSCFVEDNLPTWNAENPCPIFLIILLELFNFLIACGPYPY